MKAIDRNGVAQRFRKSNLSQVLLMSSFLTKRRFMSLTFGVTEVPGPSLSFVHFVIPHQDGHPLSPQEYGVGLFTFLINMWCHLGLYVDFGNPTPKRKSRVTRQRLHRSKSLLTPECSVVGLSNLWCPLYKEKELAKLYLGPTLTITGTNSSLPVGTW